MEDNRRKSDSEITNLKINMAELNKDIKYIKQAINDHVAKEEQHLERFNAIVQDFISKTDEKFACKATEKEVEELKKTIEGRTFEWLKMGIGFMFTLIVGYLLAKLK